MNHLHEAVMTMNTMLTLETTYTTFMELTEAREVKRLVCRVLNHRLYGIRSQSL